jgi:hypothetical protein
VEEQIYRAAAVNVFLSIRQLEQHAELAAGVSVLLLTGKQGIFS